MEVRKFARSQAREPKFARRLLFDCLASGAQPNEAFIWRRFFAQTPHPLPGRAAGRLLSRIGNKEQHQSLSDKQGTAEALARAGLPVPELLEIIPRGQAPDPTAAAWSQPGQLFVKPRRGSAARGAMAIDVLAPDRYRIANGPLINANLLQKQLSGACPEDDLMVQTRLQVAPAMEDLAAAGAAPVLRLTAARNPGEAAFLHSALLSVDVPGESPRNFIRGKILAPIDLNSGRMERGLWFLNPGERYCELPWNQAPLVSRRLPDFERAAEITLRATALFPSLAIVNWDLIVTPSGPVVLEGNTCGDWILTNLPCALGLETVPLTPLLDRWSHESAMLL
jgi:hypothetical protein